MSALCQAKPNRAQTETAGSFACLHVPRFVLRVPYILQSAAHAEEWAML